VSGKERGEGRGERGEGRGEREEGRGERGEGRGERGREGKEESREGGSTCEAKEREEIINEFQEVIILSSRNGRGRRARIFFNIFLHVSKIS
jgi:hypothetical protein